MIKTVSAAFMHTGGAKKTVIAAATSSGAAATSWFATTLPVVQWCAAAVAVLSGLVALAVGLTKLHDWWGSRRLASG
jgi:hypothetical protein